MRGTPIIPVAGGHLADGVIVTLQIESAIGKAMVGRGVAGIAAMDAYREAQHAARFDSALKAGPRFGIAITPEAAKDAGIRVDSVDRFDSFSPNAGLFMARQLEHIFARVLETPYPEHNGVKYFPINTEVAPGARTYTIRRFSDTGEAVIWRGGGSIPRVGMAQQEESRPVRHIVSSFAYDIFDQMSAQFANIGLVAGLLKACRKAIAEKWNRLIWYGSATSDIYGVLTYPYLAKKSVATSFDGSADPDDVIAELNAMANYAAETSNGVFRSNACMTTPEVRNYLFDTPRSANTDTSIGKWWLENNSAGIKEIKVAWELKEGGSIPAGSHGFLFYKEGDEDAIRNVTPQTFTTLPMQRVGLEDVTIAYQSTGGISMPDVGHNLLGFVDV